jgi:hypothetical protein
VARTLLSGHFFNTPVSGKPVPGAFMQAEYAREDSDPIGLSSPEAGILDSRFRGKDVGDGNDGGTRKDGWAQGGYRDAHIGVGRLP